MVANNGGAIRSRLNDDIPETCGGLSARPSAPYTSEPACIQVCPACLTLPLARQRLEIIRTPTASSSGTEPARLRSGLPRHREARYPRQTVSVTVVTGQAQIAGMDVAIGVMEVGFRGGSMAGSWASASPCPERAAQQRLPVIIVSASRGRAHGGEPGRADADGQHRWPAARRGRVAPTSACSPIRPTAA